MKLGVVGLGKIGSCLAALLSQRIHDVTGVDINPEAVQAINHGQIPPNVLEPGLETALMLWRNTMEPSVKRLVASEEIADAIDSDYIFIIVPTPSGPNGMFEHVYVAQVLANLFAVWDRRTTEKKMGVVIVSTLTPETMTNIMQSLTTKVLGPRADEVELIYSPVFVALGSVIRDLRNPDTMLVGTRDGTLSDVARGFIALFRETLFITHVRVVSMTWQEAELAKLFTNVMLSVKSLYANELAILASASGIDAAPILEFTGNDSRIGPKMLGAGFPPGGTCLPRDVRCIDAYALHVLKSKEHTPLLTAMLEARKDQFQEIAAEVAPLCPPREQVGILGLTYKPGVPIVEESGSLILAKVLYDTYRIESYLHDFDVEVPMRPGCAQLETVDEVLGWTHTIVLGTSDRRYLSLLTPQVLSFLTVYDVWGILTPEQVSVTKCYRRFGKGGFGKGGC